MNELAIALACVLVAVLLGVLVLPAIAEFGKRRGWWW